MNTRITGILALFLIWGTSIEAAEYNHCPVPPPPPRPFTRPCCCTEVCVEPEPICDPYSYSCDEFCPGECHFFFGVEGLWWTACENDLDFAVDFNSAETSILGIGETHFADYQWDWGVRGWLGWNWCCGWDTTISYTWFQNRGLKTIDVTELDSVLKASLLHPNTDLSDADIATAELSLKYHALDVLFGRTLVYCQDAVNLHPFFGFHGIRIKQNQDYLYQGGEFGTEPANVSWDSTLKGAGIIGGTDINLKGPGGIGIFGSIGGSILASKTDVEHLQQRLDAGGEVTATDIDLKEDSCICVPGLHVNAGLSFETAFCGCLLMKFHLLYEFNNYFNTPHLRRYSYNNEGVSSSAHTGNIALQGITFGGEIFF